MSNLFEMLVSNSVMSAILAVVVFGVSRRIRRPAVTHCLWVIVLLKLVTPPIVPLRISVPEMGGIATNAAPERLGMETPADIRGGLEGSGDGTQQWLAGFSGRDVPAARTAANVGSSDGRATNDSRLERTSWGIRAGTLVPMAMYAWLASSLAVLGVTVARGYSFWRLLRTAKPAPEQLQVEAERLAESIGLRRCPRVLLLSANLSPMVWAPLGKPQLLFPETLLGSLQPDALRALLLHELSHLKRGDHWVRILELGATALYWWNPVLWWVRREIRVVEEQCCDTWVVSELPDVRADYATGLVQTVGFLSRSRVALPVAASGIGGFVELDRRVRMIMTETHPRRLSTVGRWALMLIGIICLSAFPVLKDRTLSAEESSATDKPGGEVSEPAAKPTSPSATSQPNWSGRLHGRVVGPDGKAVRYAKIWLAGPPRGPQAWSRRPRDVEWTELAHSGDDGKFAADVELAPFQDAIAKNPLLTVRVAATFRSFGLARDFGWAWADVRVAALAEDIALQLTKDVPINGRLLTADGEPAAGVTVMVNHIYAVTTPANEIRKAAASSTGVYTNTPAWNGGGPIFRPIVTDADGRFRIDGMGANRGVRLQTVGGEIGSTRLNVITLPTPEELQPSGAVAVREGIAESTYFADFTHIGAPARTFRGQVTDVETGEPVPGVRISSLASWRAWTHPVMTDNNGRYEITGVPKAAQYRLEFETTKSRHFNKGVVVVDTDGLQPLEVDVELVKGIAVTGRVTDAESGSPVRGTVSYEPLFGNENVVTRSGLIHFEFASTQIDEDGSYTISVLPGRGLIAVETDSDQYLSATVDAERVRKIVGDEYVQLGKDGSVEFIDTSSGPQRGGHMSTESKQAIVLVDPSDEQPFTVGLQVVPGISRHGTILDEREEPLVGAKVFGSGVSAAMARDRKLETANFTVAKLAPGRERSLLFVHRERELGARVVVSGDDLTRLTVRMQRTGRVTGRFVDKLGEPMEGVQVVLGSEDLRILGVDGAKVDDDGRFTIPGLIEDCSYRLTASIAGGVQMHVAGDFTISSGETKDLGTFTKGDESQFRRVDE